jgi:hypothetical protein
MVVVLPIDRYFGQWLLLTHGQQYATYHRKPLQITTSYLSL